MRIDHEQFKAKYLNTQLDYDGVAAYQCADVAKAYADQVWGVRYRAFGVGHTVGGVINAFYNYPDSFIYHDEVELIKNDPSDPNQIPEQGDMPIWDYVPGLTTLYGHIAVVDSADKAGFTSIDQNWGEKRVKLIRHTYKGVLGWLRKRTLNQTTQSTINNQHNQDMQQLREYFEDQIKAHNLTDQEIERHAVRGRPNGLLNAGEIQQAIGEFQARLQWVLNDRQRVQEVTQQVKPVVEPVTEPVPQVDSGRPFGISKKLVATVAGLIGVPTQYMALIEFLPEEVVVTDAFMSTYALPLLYCTAGVLSVYIISQAIIDWKKTK